MVATTTPRAAIYCRTATVDQRAPDPLDTQELLCRDAAAWAGYAIDPAHVYREIGSGAAWDRPGLTALLAAVRAGQVAAVIAPTPDRLGRDVRQFAAIVRACERAGVALAFAADAPARPMAGMFAALEV